ncbi:MAG: sugar ABC transporter permease [Devosia sp.]|uniref:carbohydrate ABC transporter permease n=1 Tax=Devosia sp. TaxID=1871048 RepID=UPI001AD4CA20|nr:sugar ABC transporter permease [Devosia sp.]MBN9309673.1 sugar ABC transporter permease [Devosia sp.]MBN9315326.1 sugar ABC transporter permease [Devosia sp.]
MPDSTATLTRGAVHRSGRGGWSWFARRYGAILPMAPGMLFLVVMSIYPTIYSLVISLFRWNLSDPTRMRFGGWHNFGLLLTDVTFWNAVGVTFKFVLIAVSLELILGLAIALLFFQRFPGDRFLRALLILPMVVAPVVVGLLSRYMLNVQFGIITFLTEALGLGRIDFFGEPNLALGTLIVIDIWQWTPFMFLIMLAALQGVPEDIIEAAKVDGARPVRIFFDHILHLIRYPVAVAVALRLIDAFRVYDIIFMTTRGGPIDVTQTLSWQIYDAGFKSLDIGYAAAYSWLMLIIVVATVTLVLRLLLNEQASR